VPDPDASVRPPWRWRPSPIGPCGQRRSGAPDRGFHDGWLPSLRWPTPRRSSLIRFFSRLICSSSAPDCRTQQDHPPAVPLPWLGQGIIHRESLMPCTHAGVVCTRRRAYGLLPSEGCYLLVLIEMAHHAIPTPVMLMLTRSIMPSSSQGSDDRQRAVAVQTRLIRATGYYQPCRAAYRGLSRSNWQPELREALWAQLNSHFTSQQHREPKKLLSDRWGLVASSRPVAGTHRDWTAARTERIANMCRDRAPHIRGARDLSRRGLGQLLCRAPHPALKLMTGAPRY